LKPLLALLPAEIQTTRLRRFRSEDCLAFHAYRTESDLARFQGWSPMSIEDAGAFVGEMSQVTGLLPGQWIQLAIAEQSTDTLVGDVGLYYEENESEAEVGITLSKSAQGRGHATRAVRLATQLTLAASSAKYVRGVTDARNIASIRTLERADFVFSRARQAEFKGELCNELVYEFCRAGA
jgi:aminoglycoside 6'-N-acetyltransferase